MVAMSEVKGVLPENDAHGHVMGTEVVRSVAVWSRRDDDIDFGLFDANSVMLVAL